MKPSIEYITPVWEEVDGRKAATPRKTPSEMSKFLVELRATNRRQLTTVYTDKFIYNSF